MPVLMGPIASGVSPLSAATDKLLAGQRSNLGEKDKIESSAKEFESLLLGSWLQQAEDSFAKVPGGEDEDDQDAGEGEMQGIAMQSLGSAMAAGGGIGIAKMIVKRLEAGKGEASGPGQK